MMNNCMCPHRNVKWGLEEWEGICTHVPPMMFSIQKGTHVVVEQPRGHEAEGKNRRVQAQVFHIRAAVGVSASPLPLHEQGQ